MPKQPNADLRPRDPGAAQIELALDDPFVQISPVHVPLAPIGLPGEKRRSVALGSATIDYTLKRSARRSIGFVVGEHGLAVTAPLRVSLPQIEQAIRSKQRWILNRLTAQHERRRLVPQVAWQDGGRIPYLGNHLALCVSANPAFTSAQRGARAIAAVRLHVPTARLELGLAGTASERQIKERAVGWLKAEAVRVSTERLEYFAVRLGVDYRAFRLSSAETRWGSCTAGGRIFLNWRLIHFPPETFDYVVVHELAHRREMNHSPRFWQLVADVLPDYPARRALLKNPPPPLMPHL